METDKQQMPKQERGEGSSRVPGLLASFENQLKYSTKSIKILFHK